MSDALMNKAHTVNKKFLVKILKTENTEIALPYAYLCAQMRKMKVPTLKGGERLFIIKQIFKIIKSVRFSTKSHFRD